MIGLPSSSGGGNISTGLNQGSAQVLDTSSFDPITFVQNINKERERRELEKQKKQLDLNAKWAKIGTPNVSYVTDYNIEELNKQVDDYSKFITESMKKGVDPETDIELRNTLQKMQMGILQTEQMSRGIDAAVKAYSEKAKGYPPEQWAQWNEGLKMQPTVKDRLNYVQTNNPFEEIIDPLELLADVIDPKVLEEVSQEYLGNGRQRTTTSYDQDGLKKILDVSLYNNPAKKDKIEAYYRQGGFQNADEMQNSLYEAALTMIPKENVKTTIGWKPSSGGSGGENANPNTEITPAGITTKPKLIAEEDVINPKTNKVEKGMKSLVESEDPNDLMKIAETDLEGVGSDVGGIFVVNVKDNTQTREGNFIDVYGKPVTGKVNGFKFSKDGSLWVYVSDKLLPLVPSTRIKSQAAKDKGNANAQQVAKSLGREWSDIKSEIYNRKEGNSGGASTPTKTGGNISSEEFRKMTVSERQKFKANGGKVDGK